MKSKWGKVKEAALGIKIADELKRSIINPKVEGITQSMLRSCNCLRYLYLSLRKWESLDVKLTHANGAITHDMLDNCYTYFQENGELPRKTKLMKWIDNYDIENPDWIPSKNAELISKYKLIAFTVVWEYLRYYSKKGEFTNNTILGAEDIFDLDYKGIKLRGKKDMRFLNKNKEHWIMETKTMARIVIPDIELRLTFDPQCLMYTIAEQMEFGVKVKGVVYNIVRNPGHKWGANETLQKYCMRIRKEIRKKPEHFFIRKVVRFTKRDLMEFKMELQHKANMMEMLHNGRLYPVKNENACVTPFKCNYLQACSSGVLNGYSRTKTLYKELQ